jgi:hypothetical protein
MTMVMPEGTPTLGNTKLKAVLTIADPEAPKLATEINAVSSVDISCFVYPAGWNPAGSQGKGTKPRRLCETGTRDSLNTVQWTAPALQYVHNPQGDDADPVNAAKAILTEGTLIHVLERQGLDADEDFAVDDRTRDHYLRLGAQIPSGDLTDENGEFFIMQEAEYVLNPVDGVVVT